MGRDRMGRDAAAAEPDVRDGDSWRRGYDDWRTTAPDVGSGGLGRGQLARPSACVLCGLASVTLDVMGRCAAGHTPQQRDAAANKQRARVLGGS